MNTINNTTVVIAIAIIAISVTITVHEMNKFATRLDIQKTQELNAEKVLRQSAEDNASHIQQSAEKKLDEVITEVNKFNYGA